MATRKDRIAAADAARDASAALPKVFTRRPAGPTKLNAAQEATRILRGPRFDPKAKLDTTLFVDRRKKAK